jgi:hypothetical protein
LAGAICDSPVGGVIDFVNGGTGDCEDFERGLGMAVDDPIGSIDFITDNFGDFAMSWCEGSIDPFADLVRGAAFLGGGDCATLAAGFGEVGPNFMSGLNLIMDDPGAALETFENMIWEYRDALDCAWDVLGFVPGLQYANAAYWTARSGQDAYHDTGNADAWNDTGPFAFLGITGALPAGPTSTTIGGRTTPGAFAMVSYIFSGVDFVNRCWPCVQERFSSRMELYEEGRLGRAPEEACFGNDPEPAPATIPLDDEPDDVVHVPTPSTGPVQGSADQESVPTG